ncbi:MAG: FHA domain-containing protein [Anaerolineaceae bacterium]|jgi:hypothetical protein|nr:FHA domain-containing protein [Anaerolineaceae bacterium]MDD4042956.1 FHA domain-containing protein [Anaerolineaceae bacterium]MDD4578087.1 FHA domain-containing protein [Anaerolineaceae bacterium]
MRKLLQTIEDKLRYLLEEKLDRLVFPGVSSSLSYTLIELIEDEIEKQGGRCENCMPDLITLKVSSERWEAWQESLPLLDEVLNVLEESWKEQGYVVRKKPVIQLVQSPDLSSNQIKVEIDYSLEESTSPKTALQKLTREPLQDALPKDACLIIADREPFFLTKAVINIGRRSTNDLVLDDPLISRDHLQLRADNGRFYLFDLGSKAGTTINNFPASNVALKPGDVIQIGGTTLIYNQWVEQTVSKPTRSVFGGKQ